MEQRGKKLNGIFLPVVQESWSPPSRMDPVVLGSTAGWEVREQQLCMICLFHNDSSWLYLPLGITEVWLLGTVPEQTGILHDADRILKLAVLFKCLLTSLKLDLLLLTAWSELLKFVTLAKSTNVQFSSHCSINYSCCLCSLLPFMFMECFNKQNKKGVYHVLSCCIQK